MENDQRRRLLADAAERGIRYLEGLAERRAFPDADSIARLEEALSAPVPDGPAPPSQVLAMLDDLGSPATVASAGGGISAS